MYIADCKKIFQQIENLKTDGYAGINIGTRACNFLGVEESSLKTAIQIYKSKASYSIDFHAFTYYLTSMVQKTPVAKKMHIAITATEVDGLKLENWDGADQRLPPVKSPELHINYFLPSRSAVSGKTARRPRL